jgi:pre-mRNA cleavage complex 2 protein Pcf11
LRSPPPQRPVEPARPAAAAPPPSDPSALLAMLRQSGLLKPGATPAPPQAAPAVPNLGGFQSLAGAAADRSLRLTPASLKM